MTGLNNEEGAIKIGVETLDNLFVDFNKLLFARQNHWCCGSCGSYSCSIDKSPANDEGYVFYHYQSLESFNKTGYLHLYYSSFTEEVSSAIIAKLIVDIVKKHNIDYEWNGEVDSSIILHLPLLIGKFDHLVPCEDCDGNEILDCEWCGGSGDHNEEYQCKLCGGEGMIGENECDDCNGDGAVFLSEICDSCNGDGYIDCKTCS